MLRLHFIHSYQISQSFFDSPRIPPSLINIILLANVPGPDPQGEGGQQEEHGGDGQEARPDKVQSRPGEGNKICW